MIDFLKPGYLSPDQCYDVVQLRFFAIFVYDFRVMRETYVKNEGEQEGTLRSLRHKKAYGAQPIQR